LYFTSEMFFHCQISVYKFQARELHWICFYTAMLLSLVNSYFLGRTGTA
jgi:hypothetical protein